MKSFYKDKQSEDARQDLVGERFGRLVVTKMLYEKNSQTKVECVCDCGNIVKRIATYLTSGNTTSCGCYQRKRASESNTKDYSGIKSEYGIKLLSPNYQDVRGRWFWNCECLCGAVFTALPAKILNGHITSCGCAKQSARERLISRLLDANSVVYESQYTFDDCKDKQPLPFDFYIPYCNTAIEYQGKQHYTPSDFFGGELSFKYTKRHDEIKKEYCRQNNIRLIELPYTLSDSQINDILSNAIYP